MQIIGSCSTNKRLVFLSTPHNLSNCQTWTFHIRRTFFKDIFPAKTFQTKIDTSSWPISSWTFWFPCISISLDWCMNEQVANIQINYARVAKKMDMRRLKSTMWNVLSSSGTQRVRRQCTHRCCSVMSWCSLCFTLQTSSEAPVVSCAKPFTSTYHHLPSILPQKMADNLSVALAFAALLHLANENSLRLEQPYGDLNDFLIVDPKQEQIR